MDADRFQLHLAATLAWCRPRFSIERPRDSLRSAELRPSIIDITGDDLSLIHDAVNSVMIRRTVLLGAIDQEIANLDGRLLAFYPRHSLCDGISEIETRGFIDATNTPPWDSWVCMVGELLISWVPPAIVNEVQAAIIFNVECIEWLSDVECDPIVSNLRRNHLLR